MALLVASGDPAEPVTEEVVALERQELPRQLTFGAAHDLRDGDRGVVVGGLGRDAAEELKGSDMAGLEGLGAFAWESRDEEGVRVRKGHHRQCCFAARSVDLDRCFAEVELGFARGLAQGDEDFSRVQPPVSDGRSNLGRRALVAVFVAEALEDALGRVALLDRRVTVIEQDLVDDADELAELWLGSWRPLAITRGFRVGQDLVQGL